MTLALQPSVQSPKAFSRVQWDKIQPAKDVTAGLTPLFYFPKKRYYLSNYAELDGADHSALIADFLAMENAEIIFDGSGDWVADGPILIGGNTAIIFESPDVSLRVPNGGMATDIGFLRLRDVDNVTIEGNGARVYYTTKPVADEQRHCLDIRGSSRVRVSNLRLESAGGDGCYVGAGAVNNYCQDVELIGLRCYNNRRQGLSIVSAIGCEVRGGSFISTDGTSPQSGIDLEPNVSTDELRGIRLIGVRTADNTGAGIKATINDLTAGYHLGIYIAGHEDYGSQNAFNPQYGTAMRGRFIYEGGHSILAKGSAAFVRGWRSTSAQLVIDQFTVDDPNESNDTTNAYNGHGVSVFATGSDAADDIGNVDIIGLRCRDNRGSPQMKACVYVRNSVAAGTSSKVRVIDPLDLAGFTTNAIELKFTENVLVRDPLELSAKSYAASSTISTTAINTVVDNTGASGTVLLDLDSNCPVGHSFTARVRAAQLLQLDPDGSSLIKPGGANGVRIQSSQVGAEIELYRESTTVWRVVRTVGRWNFSNGAEAGGADHLEGSATWNPGSVANGAQVTTTVTVTGATLGDYAIASFSLDTGGLCLSADVTSANTVTVKLHNTSGGAVDLASGTLRARVFPKPM